MDAAATKRILEGRLPLEMARFGVPVALGMGLQVTFNLVDAYLVSRLQPEVAGRAGRARHLRSLLGEGHLHTA